MSEEYEYEISTNTSEVMGEEKAREKEVNDNGEERSKETCDMKDTIYHPTNQ